MDLVDLVDLDPLVDLEVRCEAVQSLAVRLFVVEVVLSVLLLLLLLLSLNKLCQLVPPGFQWAITSRPRFPSLHSFLSLSM